MNTDPDLPELRLPTGKKLVLSPSPHLSGGAKMRNIMLGVLLALLPAVAASVWLFGCAALCVIVCTALFCIGAEALWCLLARKPLRTALDGSAAVTGVLLALCLPPGAPWYVSLIGAFLAIWLGKQVYGGLGRNPFNPALVARVGLLIALPAALTTWTPSRGMTHADYPEAELFFAPSARKVLQQTPDAFVTCATPLGIAGTTKKETGELARYTRPFRQLETDELLLRYFWGDRAGSLGETCVPALLLGYLILVALNLINWRIPLFFVGTVVLITGTIHYIWPGVTPSPLFHILSGGLLLGAIFMATDMVTTPITGGGCAWFAIGCGLITSLIRIWGNYPEGVSFSILFMNALVPLLDKWCAQRPFGYVRLRKEVQK